MSVPSGAAPGQRPARRLTPRLAVRAGVELAAAFAWIPLTVVLAVRGASADVVITCAVAAVLFPYMAVSSIFGGRRSERRRAARVAAIRAAQSGTAPGQRPPRRLTERSVLRGIELAAAFVWIPLTLVLAARGASAVVVITCAVPAVLLPAVIVNGVIGRRLRARRERRDAATGAAGRVAPVPDPVTLAIRAEAVAVGRKHKLGRPRQVKQDWSVPVPLVAGWTLAGVPGVMLLAGLASAVTGGLAQPGVPQFLGGVSGAVATGIVLIAVGRRRRQLRGWRAHYPGGYAQVLTADPRPRVVRWADVTEVTFTIRRSVPVNRGEQTRIYVSSFSARPSASPAMPAPLDADDLPGEALAAAGPRLLAGMLATCAAGGVVSFGEIRVSSAGVVLPGSPELVPWAQIGSVRRGHTVLTRGPQWITSGVFVSIAGEPRPRDIDLSGIPNGMCLPALLEQAAGRAPRGRTGRRPAPARAGRAAAPVP